MPYPEPSHEPPRPSYSARGRTAGKASGQARRQRAAERAEAAAVVTTIEVLVRDLPPLPDQLRSRLANLLGGDAA